MPEAPRCGECGQPPETEGAGYCDDCSATCERCDEITGHSNAGTVHTGYRNDEVWCEDCTDNHAITCEDCGETWAYSRTYDTTSGRVCQGCYDNYTSCDDCGDAIHVDRAVYRDDTAYCGDCDPGEPGVIGRYHSSNPCPVESPWTERNGRFLGVELELEAPRGEREDYAERILSGLDAGKITEGRYTLNLIHAEEDGSLDHGFELVSQPLGLDDHSRLWPEVARLAKGCTSHNTDTCGLHVHVSRAGLSGLQIAKAVYFLNHPRTESLIRTVARRYDTGYCKVKSKTLASGAERSGDRYELLNLCPYNTVEFRIFKGTLLPLAILAAIEFSNAVIAWTAPASGAGFDLTVPAFLAFIASDAMRKDTANLRAYIASRSRILGETLPPYFIPSSPKGK